MGKLIKVLACLPLSSSMRGKCYRLFKIGNGKYGENFRIGFGSYIDARNIIIGDNVSIGNMMRAKLLDRFELGDWSSIGSSTIVCGGYEYNKVAERNFVCGKKVGILCSHYFDVVAPVIVGDNVTIAGKWTQVYTHSFDLTPNRLDGGVTIGNNVYIGAGSLINLGVCICDNVVIQAGTCVNKDISEPGVYTSNTFMRRGNVHEYSELYTSHKVKKLETGINVYLKEDNDINDTE